MPNVTCLNVCTGAGCVAAGSLAVQAALREALARRGLDGVKVVGTGCLGPCAGGPVLTCEPGGIFYQKVAPADADRIVEQTVVRGAAWPA